MDVFCILGAEDKSAMSVFQEADLQGTSLQTENGSMSPPGWLISPAGQRWQGAAWAAS